MTAIRLAALVATLALVGAACAGSDEGGGVASLEGTTTTFVTVDVEVDSEQALLEFAQCMRDSGIDVPDPTVDADGNVRLQPPSGGPDGDGQIDRETRRVAQEACQEYLEGVTLGTRNRDDSDFQDLLVEFAGCVRDAGFDIPDPDFSAGPGQGGPFGGLDRTDPDLQAALEECGEILGDTGRGQGPPPGGGNGGG